MSIIWIGLLASLGLLLLALFLYWAFVTTEGAYLGARVVAWTYDLTARRYDNIKKFNRREDVWFLAQPMLLALNGVDCPLILDVATGTGRLPDALFQHPRNPYTIGLLRSLPWHQKRKSRFKAIPGQVPDPLNLPAGCPFHPRCGYEYVSYFCGIIHLHDGDPLERSLEGGCRFYLGGMLVLKGLGIGERIARLRLTRLLIEGEEPRP